MTGYILLPDIFCYRIYFVSDIFCYRIYFVSDMFCENTFCLGTFCGRIHFVGIHFVIAPLILTYCDKKGSKLFLSLYTHGSPLEGIKDV